MEKETPNVQYYSKYSTLQRSFLFLKIKKLPGFKICQKLILGLLFFIHLRKEINSTAVLLLHVKCM